MTIVPGATVGDTRLEYVYVCNKLLWLHHVTCLVRFAYKVYIQAGSLRIHVYLLSLSTESCMNPITCSRHPLSADMVWSHAKQYMTSNPHNTQWNPSKADTIFVIARCS